MPQGVQVQVLSGAYKRGSSKQRILFFCCHLKSENDLSCDKHNDHGEVIRIEHAVHVAVAVSDAGFRYLRALVLDQNTRRQHRIRDIHRAAAIHVTANKAAL